MNDGSVDGDGTGEGRRAIGAAREGSWPTNQRPAGIAAIRRARENGAPLLGKDVELIMAREIA